MPNGWWTRLSWEIQLKKMKVETKIKAWNMISAVSAFRAKFSSDIQQIKWRGKCWHFPLVAKCWTANLQQKKKGLKCSPRGSRRFLRQILWLGGNWSPTWPLLPLHYFDWRSKFWSKHALDGKYGVFFEQNIFFSIRNWCMQFTCFFFKTINPSRDSGYDIGQLNMLLGYRVPERVN